MNQTAGPPGLMAPTLLVFSIHPRMLVTPVDLPNHQIRCKPLAEARAGMRKKTARDHLDGKLRTHENEKLNDLKDGGNSLHFRALGTRCTSGVVKRATFGHAYEY